MYFRHHTGSLVFIKKKDKHFYENIWKIKYNISLEKPSFTKRILRYIEGSKIL